MIPAIGFLATLALSAWLGSQYSSPDPVGIPYRVAGFAILMVLNTLISRRIR